MSDEVKFIFKTLIKVPVIIMVSFFILNVFAFFFIYFKVLGTSYVIMQVAVENNYLPASEIQQLYTYINDWNASAGGVPMVENAGIIVFAGGTDVKTMTNISDTTPIYGEKDARTRKQYGNSVTCGIRCDYTMVWPLSYRETFKGAGYDAVAGETGDTTSTNGLNGDGFDGFKSEDDLEQMRKDKWYTFPIEITYTVPGLKYYPDMLTY